MFRLPTHEVLTVNRIRQWLTRILIGKREVIANVEVQGPVRVSGPYAIVSGVRPAP